MKLLSDYDRSREKYDFDSLESDQKKSLAKLLTKYINGKTTDYYRERYGDMLLKVAGYGDVATFEKMSRYVGNGLDARGTYGIAGLAKFAPEKATRFVLTLQEDVRAFRHAMKGLELAGPAAQPVLLQLSKSMNKDHRFSRSNQMQVKRLLRIVGG